MNGEMAPKGAPRGATPHPLGQSRFDTSTWSTDRGLTPPRVVGFPRSQPRLCYVRAQREHADLEPDNQSYTFPPGRVGHTNLDGGRYRPR